LEFQLSRGEVKKMEEWLPGNKTEKEKNAFLEKELNALKEKNSADKTPPAKSNNKNVKQDSGNSGTRDSIKKDTTIFKLPIEN